MDLGSLPHYDAGPLTEVEGRREKFAHFKDHCTQVGPGIFLGGDTVARSREILRAAGITHIINTIGHICPNHFADELEYLTLCLNGEDRLICQYACMRLDMPSQACQESSAAI